MPQSWVSVPRFRMWQVALVFPFILILVAATAVTLPGAARAQGDAAQSEDDDSDAETKDSPDAKGDEHPAEPGTAGDSSAAPNQDAGHDAAGGVHGATDGIDGDDAEDQELTGDLDGNGIVDALDPDGDGDYDPVDEDGDGEFDAIELPDENPDDELAQYVMFDEDGNQIMIPLPDLSDLDMSVFSGTTDLEKLLKAQLAQVMQEQLPIMIDKIDEKVERGNERKVMWLGALLMGVLPGIGLFGTLLVPVLRGKELKQRAPDAPNARIWKLYVVDAIAVACVLLALGSFLTATQYFLGKMSGYTNPQIALQQAMIEYMADPENSVRLVDDYFEAFKGVANDIANDEDGALIAAMLENITTVRESTTLKYVAKFIRHVLMPALGYVFYITIGIAVLLFLKRLWPDLKAMILYPIGALEAEQAGTLEEDPIKKLVDAARRLIKIEFGAVVLFAATVFILAVVIGFCIWTFFEFYADVFIDAVAIGMLMFLSDPSTQNYLMLEIVLMFVFAIEAVVLFILGFAFLTGNLMLAYRKGFAGELDWGAVGKTTLRYAGRFFYFIALVALLGVGTSMLSNYLGDTLLESENASTYSLALLMYPGVLLVGLNLGIWLLRGLAMLKKTKAKDPELAESMKVALEMGAV